MTRWPEEREEALADLWKAGLSVAEIGRTFKLSPSAIAGKVRRLNLRTRSGAPRVRPVTAMPRPRRPAQAVPMPGEARERRVFGRPAVNPPAGSKLWSDRDFDECCFPVAGEGTFTMVCAAPCRGSYCADHASQLLS